MRHTAIDIEEFERVHAEAVVMIRNAESMLDRVEALIERMQASGLGTLHCLKSTEASARPAA